MRLRALQYTYTNVCEMLLCCFIEIQHQKVVLFDN